MIRRLILAAVAVALLLPGAASAATPALGATLIAPPSERDIELLRESGIRTARFVLSWDEVQNQPGAGFNWSRPDRWVSGLARAGVRPLPMLYGTGPFGDPPTPPVGPRARRGWRKFVRAAVERYGTGGMFWEAAAVGSRPAAKPPRAWQVWNEQNAVAFWSPEPSPREYARVLAVSAREIRAADPDATVLLGGMPGSAPRRGSVEAADYLEALYRRDAAPDFDAVAIHPYAANLAGVRGQYEAIRREMRAADDRGTETWVTEFGWGSVPAITANFAGFTRDPGGQARILRKAVRLFDRRQSDWKIRAALWFSWRDPEIEICSFCASLGLLEVDHTAKPSFRAVRDLQPKR